MRSTDTDTISLEGWLDSPLVKMACERADRTGSLDAVTVLCELHTLMIELETRLPGLPFSEIVTQSERTPQGRQRLLAFLMTERGLDIEAAQELLGPTGLPKGDQQAVLAAAMQDTAAGMYRAGFDRKAIAEKLGCAQRTADRYLAQAGCLGKPLNQRQIDAAIDSQTEGATATARRLGVSPLTVRSWRKRYLAAQSS